MGNYSNNTEAGHTTEKEMDADLHLMDLQHREELVEAGTEDGDGGGLGHQGAAWRRATTMEHSEQRVISPVGGLTPWREKDSVTRLQNSTGSRTDKCLFL